MTTTRVIATIGAIALSVAVYVTPAQVLEGAQQPSAQASAGDRRRAIEAYDDALRLIERGDFDQATDLLRLAIRLKPTPERSALRSGVFRADY